MTTKKRVFDKDLGVELVLDDDVDDNSSKNKRTDPNDQSEACFRKRIKCDPIQSNQSSSSQRPSLASTRVEKHDWPNESKLDDDDDCVSENYDDIDYGDDDEDDDGFNSVQKSCEKSKLENDLSDTYEDDEHENIEHDHSGGEDEECAQSDEHEKRDQETEEGDLSGKEPMEKCKFWPACNAGEECSYYHPTKPCRAFPNCRFGKKCLYIHPPCKFSPNCTKIGCPFSHSVSTANTITKRVGPGHFKSVQQSLTTRCKYGFKCMNLMCKFSHQRSEPCRFGANCLLDTCAYTHPSDVVRKKPASSFKWSAQS